MVTPFTVRRLPAAGFATRQMGVRGLVFGEESVFTLAAWQRVWRSEEHGQEESQEYPEPAD